MVDEYLYSLASLPFHILHQSNTQYPEDQAITSSTLPLQEQRKFLRPISHQFHIYHRLQQDTKPHGSKSKPEEKEIPKNSIEAEAEKFLRRSIRIAKEMAPEKVATRLRVDAAKEARAAEAAKLQMPVPTKQSCDNSTPTPGPSSDATDVGSGDASKGKPDVFSFSKLMAELRQKGPIE